MKPLIFDATPLIYLARIGLANLLETITAPKFASRSVFTEVLKHGRAKGHADALVLGHLFEAKAISIVDREITLMGHEKIVIRRLKGARS